MASSPEDDTDQSLSRERVKTDRELAQKELTIRQRADSIVTEARTVADGVLKNARRREDGKLAQAGTPPQTLVAVQNERVLADAVIVGERRDSDHELRDERDNLRSAILQLMDAERDETDSSLRLERGIHHDETVSIAQALEALRIRLAVESRALEESVGMRDAFLAMASHELRTPLCALQLKVDGLLRDVRALVDPPPVLLSRLTGLDEIVRRMDRLVNRLMDGAALLAGRVQLRTESMNLSALTREVANRVDGSSSRPACTIVLALAAEVHGVWDRGQLERVIAGLLSNAVNYGAGKPVTVRLEDAGTTAILQVQDRGIGIDPKDHQRIFLRFERAVPGRNYGGLGLDLWLMKETVTAMGGEVSVASELGAGSTFTVVLPKSPPSAPA